MFVDIIRKRETFENQFFSFTITARFELNLS